MDEHPLLYTAEAAARALSLSRATVFELIASGELRSIKIGRSRRIPRASLEDYISRLLAAAN